MNDSDKKIYQKPELHLRGTVEQITREQNKKIGPTDGLFLNSNAITNAS